MVRTAVQILWFLGMPFNSGRVYIISTRRINLSGVFTESYTEKAAKRMNISLHGQLYPHAMQASLAL